MKTISAEEFKKIYGEQGMSQFSSGAPEKKQGAISKAFHGSIDYAKQGYEKARNAKNPLELLRGGTQIAAGGIGAVFSPLAPVTEPIGKGVDFVADKISDNPAVQQFSQTEAGKITSDVAEDVSNLSTIAGTVGGFKGAPRVANAVKTGTNKTISNVSSATQNGLSGIGNAVKPFTKEISRIPERVKTNIIEKKNIQNKIDTLPTKIAKDAAQDGLEVADIQTLYKIPRNQKTPLKKLAKITKDFAEGNTKTNPIEVVGKPIVNRLKELDQTRVKIGTELGDVAKDLGIVTKEELVPTIFQKLQKVPGMEGLNIDKNGLLNFKNTVLATAETFADRKAIQSIFESATKWGKGESKHLLRQELFEALGGKKRARLNLTATQEKAYEAIRQGLSDVLESKNTSYKNLSNQYRQVIQPLQEMRKMMKVAGEADDILDMSAGLLARRLTSAAQSNPQIRAVLSAMDKATKKAGNTRLSVETLQDFYNILEKYYDIAPKTGFQAQVKQGVERAVTGPLSYLSDKVKSFAGETPAVRQKSLENILKEILR